VSDLRLAILVDLAQVVGRERLHLRGSLELGFDQQRTLGVHVDQADAVLFWRFRDSTTFARAIDHRRSRWHERNWQFVLGQ
jgi:hypothetical protein